MSHFLLPKVGYVPLPLQPSRHQGQAGTRKVRVVCNCCNNGWMNELETKAKPILEALICGHPFSITPHEQSVMATWVTKTTMTAEFLKPRETAIPFIERNYIMSNLAPPPHWSVWIAPYVGETWKGGGIFHHGVGIYVPPEIMQVGVKNTQWTVLGLGRLIAVAASSTVPNFTFEFEDEERSNFTRLWPVGISRVTWPTPLHLTDAGVNRVAQLFSNWLGIDPPSLRT